MNITTYQFNDVVINVVVAARFSSNSHNCLNSMRTEGIFDGFRVCQALWMDSEDHQEVVYNLLTLAHGVLVFKVGEFHGREFSFGSELSSYGIMVGSMVVLSSIPDEVVLDVIDLLGLEGLVQVGDDVMDKFLEDDFVLFGFVDDEDDISGFAWGFYIERFIDRTWLVTVGALDEFIRDIYLEPTVVTSGGIGGYDEVHGVLNVGSHTVITGGSEDSWRHKIEAVRQVGVFIGEVLGTFFVVSVVLVVDSLDILAGFGHLVRVTEVSFAGDNLSVGHSEVIERFAISVSEETSDVSVVETGYVECASLQFEVAEDLSAVLGDDLNEAVFLSYSDGVLMDGVFGVLVVQGDLSVVLDSHAVVLVRYSEGCQEAIGVSSGDGEVAVDSVSSQEVVAGSWESQVLSVESKYVLSLDNDGLH